MRVVDFIVKQFMDKPPSDDALWAALTGPRNRYSDNLPRAGVVAIDMQADMLPEVEILYAHEAGFHKRQSEFVTTHNDVFNRLGAFIWNGHVFTNLITSSNPNDVKKQQYRDNEVVDMGHELQPVIFDDQTLSMRVDERSPQLIAPLNPRALKPGAKILLKQTMDLFKAEGSGVLVNEWQNNKIDTVLLTGAYAEQCVTHSFSGLAENHFDLKAIIDPDLIVRENFEKPDRGWIYANTGYGNPRLLITEPGQVARVLDKNMPR